MRLPFLSTRSHDAIVAAKEAQIATLEGQIRLLVGVVADSREDRKAIDTKLLELVEKSMREPEPAAPVVRERRPDPPTLDLSLVDPDDTQTLALIAAREVPPGSRMTGTAMMARVRRLRDQVLEAHAAATIRASTPGTIPETVSSMIDDAVEAGKNLAHAGAQ